MVLILPAVRHVKQDCPTSSECYEAETLCEICAGNVYRLYIASKPLEDDGDFQWRVDSGASLHVDSHNELMK
jgi:hypothetical protein